MGTRGALGFRINGIDKITYNHFDSYPDGLGKTVVNWVDAACSPNRLAKTIEAVKSLRVIANGDDSSVTADDVDRLRPFTDRGVGGKPGPHGYPTWYQLLRGTQGEPAKILSAGVLIDGVDFMADSLFCEFSYIVNFDDMLVEFYRGFQTKPHARGRYASMPIADEERRKGRPGDGYHPVALVGALPIASVRQWKKSWERECFPLEVSP